MLSKYFASPGVHSLLIPGIVGDIEVELTIPLQVNSSYVAILGHPHSLQGGTMQNKVVTTMVRAFKELEIPCIRFNFRGVGQTQGSFDNGVGESEDMLFILRSWLESAPNAAVFFAGFSFGSYVTYQAMSEFKATNSNHSFLLSIAPSVKKYNYSAYTPAPYPWVILQGDCDEVLDVQDVFTFSKEHKPEIPVIRFADTSHFFHGKLIELKAKLIEIISGWIAVHD